MMSAFGLANLLVSSFMGWFADRSSSRKAFLLFGLVMQGAATVLFGVVSNLYLLFASRLLQGLSAAIIYTGGLALLVDTVGSDEIGQWMGLVLSFANTGILISPLIGGLIYGWLGYRAIFFSMLAIVVLDVVLQLAMLERKGIPKEINAGRLSGYEEGRILEEDPLLPSRPTFCDSVIDSSADEGKPRTPTISILLGNSRILADLFGTLLAQAFITSFDGVLPIFVYRVFC